jgi:hypothetical protein
MVCVERTIGSEIILTHPIEPLVTWVMWNLTSFRLKTVLVLVQGRCMVCARHSIGSKSFWTHLMVPLADEAHVEACFGSFWKYC